MALRFCFLLAFFSMSLPGGLDMNSTSRAADPFDAVRSMNREAIKNENVPSLTVAVIQDGKITWQEKSITRPITGLTAGCGFAVWRRR